MPFLIGQMRIQLMQYHQLSDDDAAVLVTSLSCQLCTSPMVITREKILVAKSADTTMD